MTEKLCEKWTSNKKVRQLSFPTSVRLRADVDSMLQQVLDAFPHLNQNRVINDVLHDGLISVLSSISE